MGKRILFAWELGNGAGHLRRILPIAAGLTTLGHSVTLAVRDPEGTRSRFGQRSYPLLGAPAWRGPATPGFLASSYPAMLQQAGYADPAALHVLLNDWLDRFAATWPDVVIAEFAPTAMLAARIAGLPVIAIGDGYSLPPRRTPLPTTRPWAEVDPATMADAEAAVLRCIDAAMASRSQPSLPALEALFATEATFLCSFPELDHYEGRGPADYYGAIYDGRTGDAPAWPTGSGERVFACLDARIHPIRPLIDALEKLGVPAILHVSGLEQIVAAGLSRTAVRVTASPVRMAEAVTACDIAVCQGVGTIAAALVAGRPVLAMPAYVEQMMTLHRVVRQGYGHGVPADADADTTAAALRRLLDDAGCRRQAANFGRAYAGYDPMLATEAITEEIAALPFLA